MLEDDTESASQDILKNEWGMGENDKGKAGSALEEGQGPGEPSSPTFHGHVFGCCAGEFELKFSEPTGVTGSCVHAACTVLWTVQENSVFSLYFLRVSSF